MKRLVGRDAAEQRVADRVAERRAPSARTGTWVPSGFSSCGPTAAMRRFASNRASTAAAVPAATSTASGLSTATTGARVAAIPRLAARP